MILKILAVYADGTTIEQYQSDGYYYNCEAEIEGCDPMDDGLDSSFITEGLGQELYEVTLDETEEEVVEEAEVIDGVSLPELEKPKGGYTEITETFGNNNIRTMGAGAWLSGIQAAGGSTQGISDLLFGDLYIDDFRTGYDKFMHKMIGTEYFESWVCKAHLTDQASEGLSQIKLPDGSIATTAHVTAQRRGPQPLLCDMQLEEPCPNDGECEDNLCVLDNEVMQAWEYIIEWTARAPADSALTPGISEDNVPYISFNVWLSCMSEECPSNVRSHTSSQQAAGDRWVPLYEMDGMTDGVIRLEPGQQDTDRYVTYSMYDYQYVHFDWAVAPQGVQWLEKADFATGRGFQPNGDARDIVVEVTDLSANPTSVLYEESQGSTSSMVSSTSSEVERSTI